MQKRRHTAERFSPKQVNGFALLFMLVGTSMELYLLDHFEGPLQWIPLLCLGASLLLMLILFFRITPRLISLFQLLMGLNALSGLYGAFLHLQANYEFELEMKPTARGWELFTESLSGALPALAPGSMIVLALLGFSYSILLQQKQ
jgi:hypothetical protein